MTGAIAALILGNGPTFAEMGAKALATVRRDYRMSATKLYSEHPDKKQPAFNWGVGVMLSALNAAARCDAKYKPWLREYADAAQVYWNKGGYDVLPVPKPLDRYYDDNAWMALALVETYEVLGDKTYLERAKAALDFSLQGAAKDGGIYWRESDRASRNTCSCAPTAFACLAVARHMNDPTLVEKAKSIASWTREHLEDPTDGLYWDNISNAGKIERTKWTYNTALMIRTIKALEMPGAGRAMESSKSRWLKGGRLNDPGRFAHLLVEAWVDVEGVTPETEAAVRAVWAARSESGRLPADWGSTTVPKNAEILDQAAFVRACFVLARAK